MLRAKERLSRTAISELMKKGRRFSGALFDIRYRQAAAFKAAVVVSKKVSPTSVGRHMIKRKLIAALLSRREVLSHYELLLLTKKSPRIPSVSGYTEELDLFIAQK